MSLKSFYNSSFIKSIAVGLISPFITVYALYLGATKTMIGLISTLPNLTNIFSQLFWSSITEAVGKKRLMIILGGSLWAILWIPIALIKDPFQLMLLLIIQAFLSSASAPAWTSLLIQITPKYKRGETDARRNIMRGIGSFIGTLAGGFIINNFGFIPFLFYMIFFLGLFSRIFFIGTSEPHIRIHPTIKDALKHTFDFSGLGRRKNLRTLIKTIVFFNFAMALPSPFFSIYIIEQLGGTTVDIAFIAGIGAIVAIIFYRSWGTIIDYLGRKSIIISCTLLVTLTPLVYALSDNVIWLYLWAAVSNVSLAGLNMAVFAYFSDLVPKINTIKYVATYNLFTGLSSAVAPFIGGLIVDSFEIRSVFLLATLLRLCSLFFFDELKEKEEFKPRGIFGFDFEPFGITYKIETFISTYSLVMEEFRKDGIKLMKQIKLPVKKKE